MKRPDIHRRISHLNRELNRVPPRCAKHAMLRERIAQLQEQQRVQEVAS